jgi:hypothetical protein
MSWLRVNEAMWWYPYRQLPAACWLLYVLMSQAWHQGLHYPLVRPEAEFTKEASRVLWIRSRRVGMRSSRVVNEMVRASDCHRLPMPIAKVLGSVPASSGIVESKKLPFQGVVLKYIQYIKLVDIFKRDQKSL